MMAAGGDDVLRADEIDVAEEFPGAPEAGQAGGVEDGIDAGDGRVDGGGIANVAGGNFDFGRQNRACDSWCVRFATFGFFAAEARGLVRGVRAIVEQCIGRGHRLRRLPVRS